MKVSRLGTVTASNQSIQSQLRDQNATVLASNVDMDKTRYCLNLGFHTTVTQNHNTMPWLRLEAQEFRNMRAKMAIMLLIFITRYTVSEHQTSVDEKQNYQFCPFPSLTSKFWNSKRAACELFRSLSLWICLHTNVILHSRVLPV